MAEKATSFVLGGGEGGDGGGEGQPGGHRRRQGQDGERRVHHAEGGHDRQVDGRHDGQPDGDPAQVAAQHVDDPQGGGQHGEVGAHPLDRAHDRVHGLVGPDLHGGGGQQARGDEVEVSDTRRLVRVLVDQRAQPHPHGGQVEDGVEEAGGDRARQVRLYW